MNVLGLSFGYHDSAAALIQNGVITFADQEERYSGIKNDASFPLKSATSCLEILGRDSLHAVVFYENASEKIDRVVKTNLSPRNFQPRRVFNIFTDWALNEKFDPRRKIANTLKLPYNIVHAVDHHIAHAASAFFPSPFNEATVITLDGVGEWETATISVGKGNSFKKLSSVNFPHSLGLLYSAFTAFLGFEVNEGEYKVMGMAAYGKPTRLELIEKLIRVNHDGTFFIDQKLFDFEGIRKYPFNDAFVKIFGPPRTPESAIELGTDKISYYCDIAASVQLATENAILRIVANAVNQTGIKNVCLAGGVALNSAANGRIIRELGYQLFVQPAAGDAGGAIGAALSHSFQYCPDSIRRPMSSALIGREWSVAECKAALDFFYVKNYQEVPDNSSLVSYVAKSLSQGKAVGWFQGAAEIGPRALGGRSILADPRGGDTQARVNEKIKFREQFRPFAPAVLADKAQKYFTLDREPAPSSPESFMLAITKVREEYRAAIPAVTHIDGSARIQTVFRKQNPPFYDLIEAFEAYSGIPILLNTSFNLRGKPIVGSPHDAIETFLYSGLDVLALGPYIVEKKL